MPDESIQKLVEECRVALAAIKNPGPTTQVILHALQSELNALAAEIQQPSTPTDDQKAAWQSRLTVLREAIRQVVPDGPADACSEMFKTFASNARIFGLSLWAILGTIAMILLALWFASRMAKCGFPEEVTCALPLVATMGALGGFLASIQSFGRYVGNREFLRSWTIYYFLFPLKGSGLAIIVFLMIHTDHGQQVLGWDAARPVAPATTNAVTLKAAGPVVNTNATTGLVVTNQSTNLPAGQIEFVAKLAPVDNPRKPNMVLGALIAALTGMFSNQAIEMLGNFFSRLFGRVEGKDKYSDGQGGNMGKAK